jgi:hypothetical protein
MAEAFLEIFIQKRLSLIYKYLNVAFKIGFGILYFKNLILLDPQLILFYHK